LDIMGELDNPKINKQQAIDFIYSLQIHPNHSKPEPERYYPCGFRGSPFLGLPWHISKDSPETSHWLDESHIAVTYTALCTLRLLGDDFSRVDKKAITESLKHLQNKDGAFSPVATGSESDVRFIYCAAAISTMLQDWSGFNKEKALEFILRAQSYDYALAQAEGQESHGGSTYCALATLSLIEKLDALPHKDKLIQWLLERQVSGFQGRINKDPDTCYSFWVGSSLKILGALELANEGLSKQFSYGCQFKYGGFSKTPGVFPDVLHTYFALCGLSMMGEEGLREIDVTLGMTKRASKELSKEHSKEK